VLTITCTKEVRAHDRNNDLNHSSVDFKVTSTLLLIFFREDEEL